MEYRYDGLPPIEAAREYSLEILNYCMRTSFSEAENHFISLDLLLKEQGVKKEVINRLSDAKGIFSKLRDYYPGCPEYSKYFKILEHNLLGIPEELLNINGRSINIS